MSNERLKTVQLNTVVPQQSGTQVLKKPHLVLLTDGGCFLATDFPDIKMEFIKVKGVFVKEKNVNFVNYKNYTHHQVNPDEILEICFMQHQVKQIVNLLYKSK